MFLRVLCGLLFGVAAVYASPTINHRFLTISDIHYGHRNTSVDGQNTGTAFLTISMDKFRELSKDVDFVITLGDLPTHLLGYSPEKELYEKTVFHELFAANKQLKPMFYISGNNDSLSGNYQPFEFEGKSPLNYADDWTGACVNCDGLIIDGTYMKSHGYYSTYVMPNNQDIMLIVLNATQWTKIPIFLPQYPNQDKDALDQFTWLKAQLKANSAKQLLIAMHEPPGMDYHASPMWQPKYLDEFIKLLEQNQQAYEQITLLGSHTHMDEFRKIHLNSGKNIYLYSTPAVSRVHNNNSAMKIFDLDSNLAIKDFTTFYTTSIQKWGNEQYQALSGSHPIFANCISKNLAQCLDALSDQQLYSAVEKGLFYGVKSKKVSNKALRVTYNVN